MSGVAYFFKPKITANDSSSSSTTEKRPGRRSKHVKSSEIPIPNEAEAQPMETEAPLPETKIIHEEEEEPQPQQQEQQEQQQLEPQTPTPKIKLKFTLRSQSIHDSTSDERIITNVTHERTDLSEDESSDNETRLKIDDNQGHLDDDDDDDEQTPVPVAVSPTKKKAQSSRKKVISHLIGSTANTLSLDEPSPIKLPANESQFSEIKQTKSGRTIKYTPYFKELVQGATISPPSSPVHTPAAKRPSSYSKKKQTSIKADLDAIKNGGLPTAANAKSRKSTGSPKQKKQTASPGKRSGQGRKSTVPRTPKAKRASNQIIMQQEQEEEEEEEEEELESDDENEVSQRRSDDEEFHQEGHSSEEEEEEEGLDADDDEQSSNGASDEEEWTTLNNKQDHDRTFGLAATLGSIPSEMIDGFSLWAMKYRTRHKTMALDDKRLHRTWKKMSAHDRQRWCLKAEKENYHYPITAELLKSSSSSATTAAAAAANDSSTAVKQSKATKRKKANDDHPPILLQKTLNQYSKQQPSLSSSIRPPNAFVKQPTTPTITAPPKNYDIVDIAAGIYLLGESLTKMGEKVRQLGHLNPRGQSAATAIDNLSAILFDGTLCACNLMACLGNEIVSTNPSASKSDPLTNKLMENVGIILPGLN